MDESGVDQAAGTLASSTEFARYDQVRKADYHLAEAADAADDFDEDFEFTTCDLGQYLHGTEADRDAFSHQLGDAMSEIGFAILVGHGVDTDIYESATEWVEEFFTTQPMEEKLARRAERHGAVSEGYFPVHETSDIHPDLVEGWVFGRRAFDLDDDPSFDPTPFWHDPAFEPQFRRLVEAELPLFQPIMSSVLRYFDCDPTLYDDRLNRPNFGLRLNWYPPMSADDQGRRAGRLLGHEDIDLFTLLPAPKVEGLQVLNRDGKWVRLDAPPGSIVLNTGDYMARITNDILPSTTHRVSPPRDPQQATLGRVSFPLAAYLRPDELLEVLPTIPEPRYDPIKVITFHTRTTAKFYGDDYAVEEAVD
ncbi:MAG: 2-oxoglutarate and iron-dependent oxygenase domain-containing protein [Actinomycetota bacterium]